ncbi:MAG TPA: D-alanyl-D-alanine carboxypeptidase/D-alanyl-D-alanine-endopeptidase [Kofleriaceae bacterium]|nr:D-alanyl-D-alanine carboxypeptidase/D-alanyl-D-alanine-endopeptidase [Kofleriaceae bacterium]
MGPCRVLLAVLAVTSISVTEARSQATAPPPPRGTPAPTAAGSGAAVTDSARDHEDDEDATPGQPRKPLVAPAEPKARVQWLRDRVAAAITTAAARLAHARITVSAVDLATGNELVNHEADRAMSLASNAKLLTSVAALADLGGGFRWRTGVLGAEPDDKGVVAGDLVLRGRGDPMLGPDDFRALAADVAARGVRSVDRLVIDASYFDDAVEPPHFEEQKAETAGFRAPVAGLGVARSAVTVTVVPDPGGTATVTLDPDPGDYIRLSTHDLTSVTRGRTRIKVDVKLKPDHMELVVSGQIRWGEGSWEVRKRVSDPARFAAELFRRALVDHGVQVKARAIGRGAAPPTAKLLAVHESAPLSDVLRHMNKLSDNYLAESVLKTLGAETKATPGPATWNDGIAAMHAYLAKIGLPAAGYRAENGSGLFNASEVSARQLTTLLGAAHKDFRIGPDLLASLPVGGVDGTLARRWHARAARGRVRAKTGTLDKVVTLAGYVAVDSQHPIGFAVLVNDVPAGQRASARAAADEIVEALVAYLGG